MEDGDSTCDDSIQLYCLDSLKVVYFWRIWHGCDIESEDSVQLREPMPPLLFFAEKNIYDHDHPYHLPKDHF